MTKIVNLIGLQDMEEPKLTLVQLSTKWCGPCKQAKKYIMTTYSPSSDEYKFVDVEADNSEIITEIISILKPRGVPMFAVVDMEAKDIKVTWSGFNRDKIDVYFKA